MLATRSFRLPWPALRVWWWRARQPSTVDQRRAPQPMPRRYPIPAERAHCYARAADEGFFD